MSTGISYWDTLEGRLKKAEMQKDGTWKDRNKGKNPLLRIGEFFEGFKVIAGAGVDGSGAGADYTLNPKIPDTTLKSFKDNLNVDLSDHNNDPEKEKTSTTTLPKERLKRTYKSRGGLLRYPFEALTEKTDYLQIDIVEYEPASKNSANRNNLIGRPGSRRIPLRSRVPGGLTTQSLVNKGTVLLQIPSQVQDGNAVNYGDSEMNSIVGATLQGVQDAPQALAKGITQGKIGEGISKSGDALKNAFAASDLDVGAAQSLFNKKIATSVVGAFGGNVTVNQLLARQEGQVFNPNMELLFNGPTLRNFRFSFKMTPRSREEAEQCKLIIRTFKMNMAPKVTSGRGGQSLFLNTPNVFQLRYKTGFRNHPFLHKFKQCFLTDISVNYTGEGVYATYENREPVSMIMDLTFKELEPIYDQDYFNDRGRDLDSTVGF
jgi:hypothetical protein